MTDLSFRISGVKRARSSFFDPEIFANLDNRAEINLRCLPNTDIIIECMGRKVVIQTVMLLWVVVKGLHPKTLFFRKKRLVWNYKRSPKYVLSNKKVVLGYYLHRKYWSSIDKGEEFFSVLFFDKEIAKLQIVEASDSNIIIDAHFQAIEHLVEIVCSATCLWVWKRDVFSSSNSS